MVTFKPLDFGFHYLVIASIISIGTIIFRRGLLLVITVIFIITIVRGRNQLDGDDVTVGGGGCSKAATLGLCENAVSVEDEPHPFAGVGYGSGVDFEG